MSTGWQLNSVDLRTLGYNMRSTYGWDSFPGLNWPALAPPNIHGERRYGRGFYAARDLFLSMMVLPVDPATGQVLTSPLEHVEENIDTLLGLLHSPGGGLITVQKTLPSGEVRTADVRPVAGFPVEQGQGPTDRAFTYILRMEYPFWSGVVVNASSSPVNNPGNAPVNNMLLTFNSAGTVIVDGATVESTAAGLQLDVGARQVVSAHTDADWSASEQWILELQPGDNVVSGTAAFTMNFFAGWF